MTSNKEQEQLDKLLCAALAKKPITLDFQAWKSAHPEQIAAYRRPRRPAPFLRRLPTRPLQFAMAACLIIAAGFVLRWMQLPEQVHIAIEPANPAAMINRLQLTIAYANGGIEGLEEQYDKAYAKLGPRAGVVTVNSLFNTF